MPRPDETCVICDGLLGGKATFTAALIFGNKSRDPHVGPYCENCGPPAKLETKRVEYVKDCPVTGEEWTPISHCITTSRTYPHETKNCEFSLGRSPFQHSAISCIHPDRKALDVGIG